jgi:hypothetical protein
MGNNERTLVSIDMARLLVVITLHSVFRPSLSLTERSGFTYAALAAIIKSVNLFFIRLYQTFGYHLHIIGL